MYGITSAEAVYIALICIVPGYIYLAFRNQFVPGQDRLGTEQLLAFVTYSALNFAVFGWINLVIVPQQAASWLRIGIWMLTLLVGPAILGLISGVCTQKEYGGRIYAFLGLNTVHPTARSWDWVFHRVTPALFW